MVGPYLCSGKPHRLTLPYAQLRQHILVPLLWENRMTTLRLRTLPYIHPIHCALMSEALVQIPRVCMAPKLRVHAAHYIYFMYMSNTQRQILRLRC